MAAQSSRGQRSRQPSTARSKTATKSSAATSVTLDDKAISHQDHHRMIARNTNALLENFGELRNQVVAMDRDYKRGGENSDQNVFPLRKQLEDFEQRLTKFIEEMTQVAFESNLKIRGNSDRISALWDALETVAADTDEVKRRREEIETREEARQADIDRRLQELAGKRKQRAPAKARPRRSAARKSTRKGTNSA